MLMNLEVANEEDAYAVEEDEDEEDEEGEDNIIAE